MLAERVCKHPPPPPSHSISLYSELMQVYCGLLMTGVLCLTLHTFFNKASNIACSLKTDNLRTRLHRIPEGGSPQHTIIDINLRAWTLLESTPPENLSDNWNLVTVTQKQLRSPKHLLLNTRRFAVATGTVVEEP
jgi:hypothetical protein